MPFTPRLHCTSTPSGRRHNSARRTAELLAKWSTAWGGNASNTRRTAYISEYPVSGEANRAQLSCHNCAYTPNGKASDRKNKRKKSAGEASTTVVNAQNKSAGRPSGETCQCTNEGVRLRNCFKRFDTTCPPTVITKSGRNACKSSSRAAYNNASKPRTASEADGQFPSTSVNQATRPPDRQAATPTASSEDICPDTTNTRRYLGSSSFRKKAKVRPSSDISRRTIRRTEGKASAVK